MNAVTGRNIHVKSLRVRAPEPEVAARFRTDLEDALRTATLPDQASGSLIYIRRLDLGRLRGGLSRQALAAHLEKCLAEAPIAILRWNSSAPAPEANIVRIPDLVTAAAFAVRAAVLGVPVHWAIARCYPGLDSSPVAPSQVVQILRQLIAATSASGPGRIAELKGGLDLLIAFLNLLSESERAQLAPPEVSFARPELSVNTLVPMDEQSRSPNPSDPTTPNLPRLSQPDIALALKGSPRSVIQAAVQAVPKWGARDIRSAILLSWIAAAAEGPTAVRRTAKRLEMLIAVSDRAIPSPSEISESLPSAIRSKAISPIVKKATPNAPLRKEGPKAPVAAQVPPDIEGSALDLMDGVQHSHAGFWFLIPALRHLACDRLDDATGLPVFRATLANFAARMGFGEDDVIGGLLNDTFGCALSDPPRCAVAPHETVLALLAGQRGLWAQRMGDQTALSLRANLPFFAFPNTDELDAISTHLARNLIRDPVTGMTLAAQRLITQILGGRGWRWLVNRPGQIAITPTHIDVTFDGTGADADVRIAGLDLNPGWVPELGRVVEFHYDYSKMRDFGGWDG